MRTQIGKRLGPVIRLGMGCNGDEAIVARPIFPFCLLLRLDGADQARTDNAPGYDRLFHENQQVERIAVITRVEGKKPKIVGKDEALREHRRKPYAIAVGHVFAYRAPFTSSCSAFEWMEPIHHPTRTPAWILR